MLGTIVRVAQIGFLVTATAVLGWFLWGKLQSEPRRELDPFRRELAREAITELVYELPQRDDIRKLAVMPVVRDLDDRVLDLLYEELEGSELYGLVDRDEVLDYLREQLDGRRPESPREALEVGRALREADSAIEGVLFTSLGVFDKGRHGENAEVAIDASLLHLGRGMVVPGGVLKASRKIGSRFSLAYFTPFTETISLTLRIFVWALLTAGLPFALFPLVRAVLRNRNTTHNVIMVAGLSVADVLAALVLMGLSPGWLGSVGLLLALLGGGVYNIEVLEKIEGAV